MMNSELFAERLDESADNAKNSPKNDGFCFLGACLSGNRGAFSDDGFCPKDGENKMSVAVASRCARRGRHGLPTIIYGLALIG